MYNHKEKNIEDLLGCTTALVSIIKDMVDVEGTEVDNVFPVSASRLANSISDRSECDLNLFNFE